MIKFTAKHLLALPDIKGLIAVTTAELIGTGCLTYFGCLTLLKGVNLLSCAVGWGFIVGHCVLIFGHISGCHINPAVTLACTILGSISPLLALIYIFFQFIGGFLGFFLLKKTLTKTWYNSSVVVRNGVSYGMCTTIPNSGVSDLEAVICEFMGTAFLIAIICVAHDYRTEYTRDSFPLKVAGIIIADVICIGPLTGCSLNVARTMGPAIIENVYKSIWIYFVGTLGAGIIIPLIYALLWSPRERDSWIEPEFIQGLAESLKKMQTTPPAAPQPPQNP